MPYKTLHFDSIDGDISSDGYTTIQKLTAPLRLTKDLELKSAIFSIPPNVRASNGTNQFQFQLFNSNYYTFDITFTDNVNHYPMKITLTQRTYQSMNDVVNELQTSINNQLLTISSYFQIAMTYTPPTSNTVSTLFINSFSRALFFSIDEQADTNTLAGILGFGLGGTPSLNSLFNTNPIQDNFFNTASNAAFTTYTTTITEGYYPNTSSLLNAIQSIQTPVLPVGNSLYFQQDTYGYVIINYTNTNNPNNTFQLIENLTTKVLFGMRNYTPIISGNPLIGSVLPVPLYDTYIGLYLQDLPIEPTASSGSKTFTFKIPINQNITPSSSNNLGGSTPTHLVSSYFDNSGYSCVIHFSDKQYQLEKIKYNIIDRFGFPLSLQEFQFTLQVGYEPPF